MTERTDRLYDLLPAIYRLRDAEQGYPLKALLRVIAEQVDVVEDDIRQLYDNWFIETAQDWVVPYLGDLIGYQLPTRSAIAAAKERCPCWKSWRAMWPTGRRAPLSFSSCSAGRRTSITGISIVRALQTYATATHSI
jgi:hypothetical protein